MQQIFLQFIISCAAAVASAQTEIFPNPSHESRDSWVQQAKSDLTAAETLYTQLKQYRAKNVVLFLGDGMGLTTVTAGRILKGQLKRASGEEERLSFEKFPHTALIKTYNTDKQTPDSAGTATAYLGGVKTKSGVLGVDQNIVTRNCSSYSEANNVISFLEDAAADGKSVGIVTTTRVTHATPAAAYAHVVYREWEDDSDRNVDVNDVDERRRCPDIAEQLIRKSPKYSVVFGGGRLKFLPKNVTTNDRETQQMVNGTRSDGVNLLTRWKQMQADKRFAYIETRDELMRLDTANTDTVFGLFATSHMSYDVDNSMSSERSQQPTLSEMTTKAIEILSKNPNGFALLVEGGRIDHGHHENKASKALHDVVAFDAAISSGLAHTSDSDTLTLVTADHSHVFTIGGWADRGTNILGKVKFSYYDHYNSKGDALAEDGLPFAPIGYTDGPEAMTHQSRRRNLTDIDTTHPNHRQSSLIPAYLESHGSEDVAIYASGPGAHLFHTTHEQSYIANMVRYTICVGEFKQSNLCLTEKAVGAVHASFSLVSAVVLLIVWQRCESSALI